MNDPTKPETWDVFQNMLKSPEMRTKLLASFDKVVPELEIRVQIVNCILRTLKG